MNRFHGSKQIGVVYKEKFIASLDPADLVDLKEVVDRMALLMNDECDASLPDED